MVRLLVVLLVGLVPQLVEVVWGPKVAQKMTVQFHWKLVGLST